jgi:hypothetical protein
VEQRSEKHSSAALGRREDLSLRERQEIIFREHKREHIGFANVVAEFYEGVFLQKVGLFGRKMADLGRFLMRPAFYDSGLRFDDPNARWGSPGYALEPGDLDLPGHRPKLILASAGIKRKRKLEKGYRGLLNGSPGFENMRSDGEFVTSCWLWNVI